MKIPVFLRDYLCLLLLAATLAGCAGYDATLPLAQPDPRVATIQRIHVATIRKPSAEQLTVYSGDRADGLGYGQVDVSIPRNREPGSLKYPYRAPDLKTQFASVGHVTNRDEAAFIRNIDQALADLPRDQRSVFLFVHGYNTNFASGIFRQAQMVHDFAFPGVAVNFAWASAGSTPLYLYDRDSAQIARDGLRETLRVLAKTKANGIVLLAHSMGSFVTMEALREIGIRKEQRLLNRIEALILASPDIDRRLFEAQLAEIDKPPSPFIIFVSSKDRALQASQQLSGGQLRLGEGGDVEGLRERGIAVIDLTNVGDGFDAANHTTFATSKTVMSMVRSGALRNADKPATADTPLAPVGEGIGRLSDIAAGIIYLPAKIAGVR